ncbi:MAG: DUF6159 family protein [Thermoplasmata archaeon]
MLAYFIATYFKAATVAVATIRMKGGNPSFIDGLEAATKKIPAILGWAIISAVFGVVIAILSRRGRSASARIAAHSADLAWAVATYFVVPVMLFEDVGPLDAVGRSASVVRRTWRESLAGNFGMSVIFFLIGLSGALISLAIGNVIGGIVWGLIAAILFIAVLSIFSSAASAVLTAALYRLARTGKMPAPMEGYEGITDAFADVQYGSQPS